MSSSAVSLTTIFLIVAMGAVIGFLAGVHRRMDLEQWTVGGRGFGVVLIYLLMAHQILVRAVLEGFTDLLCADFRYCLVYAAFERSNRIAACVWLFSRGGKPVMSPKGDWE
jgi:hypothetical protein